MGEMATIDAPEGEGLIPNYVAEPENPKAAIIAIPVIIDINPGIGQKCGKLA